ncbi:carbohydrate binding family 9 domain-containing protein [bacterium]|nr:carbohydrate binding family 9 domain-containing protein [bacterium]
MRRLLPLAAAVLLPVLVETIPAKPIDPGLPSRYPRRSYETQHCGSGCPKLDGRLDDACWSLVEWASDFVQWQPDAGQAPSQQTAFKVLFDDEHLYLAYRAFDSDPGRIERQLARRDWFPGDWVEVNIDSYNDHRTAYSFTASVSGVRGDEFISQDGDHWDGSWDPIWDFRTAIDDQGWTAEVRIPLSQLRYQPQSEQTWGLQVQRRLFREEERSLWQPKSREEPGWVSRFGELRGLVGLPVQRRIELMPYAVTRQERFGAEAGNPFTDGHEGKLAGGLDGKLGVSSNLTLDFTVNPDFGQVEADPSQLNLSEFETFFQERRPFFIEGSDIFRYSVAPAMTNGRNTNDILFHSRRIGRQPAWPGWTRDYPEHLELPEASTILGAAKLTGKTAGGWSLGVLESVTAAERARGATDGTQREVPVEPGTNWFAGRLQKDFRRGDTQVGGMLTAVNRHADPGLEFMHRQAYAGGLDFYSTLWNREWRVSANLLASDVRGDSLAIALTQRSSARYFQRPDNETSDFDPQRRHLAGHAGSLRFGRFKSTGWRFETQVGWRSPGFEINDLGYQREADIINQSTWLGWAAQPCGPLRRLGINTNQWHDFDFGGTRLRRMANLNANLEFRNNMSMGLGATRAGESISNSTLRGGPAFRHPGEVELNCWFNSDHRARVGAHAGLYLNFDAADAAAYRSYWFSLNAKPSNALQLSMSPEYSRYETELQYVGGTRFGGEPRYLFADLDQETVALTLRADYAMSPNLTLQVYGSPFVTAGHYGDFKRITDPRAERFADRYHSFAGAEIVYDASEGGYLVDEDVDGGTDYRIGNPDFNYRDFNSNVVLRWEYSPGSLLYLVWSQSRSDVVGRGRLSYADDLDALFRVRGHDVFLLKVSKWLSL